jgi:hypothetical protein
MDATPPVSWRGPTSWGGTESASTRRPVRSTSFRVPRDVATIELALGDFSIRVLTIDEVIASKEKLGRPKDTAALPALYATREALRRRKR